MPWMGGQGTSPYEQKTQQVPFLGVITNPQFLHWYRMRQWSVGILSVFWKPHLGHVTVDSRTIFFSPFILFT